MLDLFCGRLGWAKAFLARGWECVGVDYVACPSEVPERCEFVHANVLRLTEAFAIEQRIDFIVASPPCEEFSTMRNFSPPVPYPEMGVRLAADLPEVFAELR